MTQNKINPTSGHVSRTRWLCQLVSTGLESRREGHPSGKNRTEGAESAKAPRHCCLVRRHCWIGTMSECLSAVCPACGTVVAEDGWEVLPGGEVHQVTCQACRTVVHASWFECESCVADNSISSLFAQDCLDRTCRKCGHHPNDTRK